MSYSARDLARKIAKELSHSSDGRLAVGAGKVEEVLAAPPAKPPTHFEAATAIAVAGLIIKVAELAYKMWSDAKKNSPAPKLEGSAVEAQARSQGIQAEPKALAETCKVAAEIVQRE